MRSKKQLRAFLVVIIAMLAAACGGGDDGGTSATTEAEESTTTTSGTEEELGEDDTVIVAAIDDVTAYWDETYPTLYGDELEPISGGFWAYGPDRESPPCGEPAPSYADIAENAFYCPAGDLIAWDTDNLTDGLLEEFGSFSLGVVMAHEFGHAIQFRAGVEGETIETEQQADCFAGSWASWVADGNAESFEVTLADLDSAVAGFLQLRDAVGTPADDPSAHGTAFDRVSAFQDGFLNGAEKCATYDEGNYIVIESPFTDVTDLESGGNAPFEQVLELAVTDLDNFWSIVLPQHFQVDWVSPQVIPYDPDDESTLPPCGEESYPPDAYRDSAFYCVPDDYIGMDFGDFAATLYDEIGDFAIATLIGNQYSFAAQVHVGNLETTLDSNLQADCFTGSWAASMALGDRTDITGVSMSPGDLDEAVIAFLAFGDPAEAIESGEGTTGTAFQRIAAFRDGFLEGIPLCLTYLEGGAPEE